MSKHIGRGSGGKMGGHGTGSGSSVKTAGGSKSPGGSGSGLAKVSHGNAGGVK